MLAVIVLMTASTARAGEGASWRLDAAQAPPAPSGVTPAPYPIPVGQVGEISFWAPNRGLLITGGTEERWGGPVAAGLYAYDGRVWHQLSTVCGGAAGRIAWAGPDEFWTISDQRGGQVLAGINNDPRMLNSLSLCHFLNGEVVGSYAMPLQQPDSYLPMDSAACYGPSDCWFGGQLGGGGAGAFHLHWDGSTVSAIYEPEDHAVSDMVNFRGKLYESVRFQGQDTYLPEENHSHPAVIHVIAPKGTGALPFSDLPVLSDPHQPPVIRLPVYGKEVAPAGLRGLSLGSDGSPVGEGGTQLWTAANPVEPAETPAGSRTASITVLRYSSNVWSQVLPDANGGSPFTEGTLLTGAEAHVGAREDQQGASEVIAPEPGTDKAWISLHNQGGDAGAVVALLQPDGKLAETDVLPGPQEPIGFHGYAGPITCPAPHDCWMATNMGTYPVSHENSVPGWLFHLTNGALQARDTDPAFAGVITNRPPDSGVPVIYPDLPPVDNSLANQQPPPAPNGPPVQTPARRTSTKARVLIEHVHGKLVNHRIFILSFVLRARARVQLIAHRRQEVVARSRRESLRPGRHTLSLLLDPKRWPTRFQFKATPIGTPTSPGAGSGETGSSDTISTG